MMFRRGWFLVFGFWVSLECLAGVRFCDGVLGVGWGGMGWHGFERGA